MEKIGNILEKSIIEVRNLVDSLIEEKENYSVYVNNAMLYVIFKKVSNVSKKCGELYYGVSNSFSGEYIAEYGKTEKALREMERVMEEAGILTVRERIEEDESWKRKVFKNIDLPWEESVDEVITENSDNIKRGIKECLGRGIEMMVKCREYAGENAEIILEQMERTYKRKMWKEDERRLREIIATRIEGKEDWEKCRELERFLTEIEWNARGLEEMWLRKEDVAREAFVNREKYCEEDYRRLFRFKNSYEVVEIEIGSSVWMKRASEGYRLLFVNRGAEEITNALMKIVKRRGNKKKLKKYQYVSLLLVMIDLGLTPHPANNSGEFANLLLKWLDINISKDTISTHKSHLVGTERRFGKEESLGKMSFTIQEYDEMRRGYKIFFDLFNTVFEKSTEDGFAKWVFEGKREDWGEIKDLERLKNVNFSAFSRGGSEKMI